MSPETNTKPLQDQATQQQELANKPDIIVINSLAEQISLGGQADPELADTLTQELQHRILIATSEVDQRLESTFGEEALKEAQEAGVTVSGGMVPDGAKHLQSTLVSSLKRKLSIDIKEDLPAEDMDLIEDIFSLKGLQLDSDRLDSDQKQLEERLKKESERADIDASSVGFFSGTDAEFDQRLDELIDSPNAPSAFGNIIGKYAEEMLLPNATPTKMADARHKQAVENRFSRVVNEAKKRFMPQDVPKQRENESDEHFRERNNRFVEEHTPQYPQFLSALKSTMQSARERRIGNMTEGAMDKQRVEQMHKELMIQKSKAGEKNPKVTDEEMTKYSASRIFNDEENSQFRYAAREEVHSVIGSINELNLDQIVFDVMWSKPHIIETIGGQKPHPNMNIVPDRKKLEKLHSNIQDKLRQPRETFLSAQTTAVFENLVERFPNAWWTNRVRHIDAPGAPHSTNATEIYSRDEVTREMDYLGFNDPEHRKDIEAERITHNKTDYIPTGVYSKEEVEAEMDYLKFNDPQHRQDIEAERSQHNKDTYTQELRNVDAELARISAYCAEKGEGLSSEQIEALLWDKKPENYKYSKKEWSGRSDMYRFVLENEKREVALDKFVDRHAKTKSGGGIEHNRKIKLLAGPLADFVTATIVRQELLRQMDQI